MKRSACSILFLILFFGAVAQQAPPQLVAYQRSECTNACGAPEWLFDTHYSKGSYRFSFGKYKTCNDGDTMMVSLKGDTLVLDLKTKRQPRVRTRNGKTDTVFTADEYECDCFYRYDAAITGLAYKPCHIKVNGKLFDWRYGFIKPGSDGGIRQYLDSLSLKYRFAFGFGMMSTMTYAVNETYVKDRDALRALAIFLRYKQTARLEFKIALSSEERALPGHKKLSAERAEELIHFLYRKGDICPSRMVYKGEMKAEASTGTTSGLWIRLKDTGSPKFPKYEEPARNKKKG